MWNVILQIIAGFLGLGNKATDAAVSQNNQNIGATLQRGADTKAVADVEQAELNALTKARSGPSVSDRLSDGSA